MRFPTLSGLLLLAVFVSPASSQQDRTLTITSGGIPRSFVVHLPADPPRPGLPVLLAFHGTGGMATTMRALTGFNLLADLYGFIVVYPQSAEIGGTRQWNVYVDDAPGHGGLNEPNAPDDVQFTRDIIDTLLAGFSIDRNRVFATGMSNGGFMCYALSMLAADRIAGIAPVAGNLWADETFLTRLLRTNPPRTIPVMHVHGTADPLVDYPDPNNTPDDYGEYPLFVAARGCGALTYKRVEPIAANVDRLVFCDPPVPVYLIRVTGMTHEWTNGSFETSREIVKFFGLNASAGIDPTSVGDALDLE